MDSSNLKKIIIILVIQIHGQSRNLVAFFGLEQQDKNIEGQWEWSSGEEWNFNDEIEI